MDVGDICYKLYTDRLTYRNMLVRWHHQIDSIDYLYFLIKLEKENKATILVEERRFVKTDNLRLGRFTFETREEAEKMLNEARARYEYSRKS